MRFLSLLWAAVSTATVSGFLESQPLAFRSKPPSSSLYATNEIATLGSLGPLDFGLLLVPISALVVRASAINDRNELQVEIETSQKFLEDAKQRLVKVEEAIKLSSVAGVLSFAFVLAFQLGISSSPVPESVLADTDSTAAVEVVSKVTKEEPKVEAPLPLSIQKTLPKVETKEDAKPEQEEETKRKSAAKVEEKSTDNKEAAKKEDVKTAVEETTSSSNDDEKGEEPYEDLLKKLEEPKDEEKMSQQASDDKKMIEDQKEEAEQKAKDFVELEGGML